jgi:hypothetical protein
VRSIEVEIAELQMRRRYEALEERLNFLVGRASIVETLYSGIAGLALRAVPDDVRKQIIRDLRASIAGHAEGSDLEMEVLQIEEYATQIIDEIGAVARGG